MRYARQVIQEWLETLPPGTTFTARDAVEVCSDYVGTTIRETSNYIRMAPGVRRDGHEGKLVRYVWEGSE